MITLFSVRGTVDRVFMFYFLSFLLLLVFIEIGKRVFAWGVSFEKIVDKFNEHLSKRDEIIQGVRKAYAFEKIKSGVFSIQYFKMLNLPNNVNTEKKTLIQFGIDKDIVEDDQKLAEFLADYGNGKYDIIVDSQNKKFIFVRKQKNEEQS